MTQANGSGKSPRSPRTSSPETHQDEPTAPPVRDDQGYELDEWGLPIVGPVRLARLAALGKPDPNVDPQAWAPSDIGGLPSRATLEPVKPDETPVKEADNG